MDRLKVIGNGSFAKQIMQLIGQEFFPKSLHSTPLPQESNVSFCINGAVIEGWVDDIFQLIILLKDKKLLPAEFYPLAKAIKEESQ